MAFYVYILQCADGLYYTGHTDNIDVRIAQHRAGGYCDFTSRRLPVRPMWVQDFSTRIDALEAERRFKPWSRAKKEALIRGDWAAVSHFARPPKERPTALVGTNGSGGKDPLTSLGTNGLGVSAPTEPYVPSKVEGPLPDQDRPSPPVNARG